MKTIVSKLFTVILIAFVASAMSAGSAVAQSKTMYKWVDENGVVHFSDKKPMDAPVEEQSIPMDAPPSGPNPYADAVAENDTASVAEQRRQDISANRKQAQADLAARQAQCESWKSELARIEPNRRVFYTNDKGETVRADDVERTDRVAELKRLISNSCS